MFFAVRRLAMVRFDILHGPDKCDLEHALFHGSSSERLPVFFNIRGHSIRGHSISGNVRVVINDVEREDGSGHNWLIEGWVTEVDLLQSGGPKICPRKSGQVRGFYSTRVRGGWLDVQEESDRLDQSPLGRR